MKDGKDGVVKNLEMKHLFVQKDLTTLEFSKHEIKEILQLLPPFSFHFGVRFWDDSLESQGWSSSQILQ